MKKIKKQIIVIGIINNYKIIIAIPENSFAFKFIRGAQHFEIP